MENISPNLNLATGGEVIVEQHLYRGGDLTHAGTLHTLIMNFCAVRL